MKILLLSLLLMILVVPFAFAENSLQDTTLTATSATVSLELEIGKDTVYPLISKLITTNHLSNIVLSFYGDEVDMSDSKLKIYSGGEAFSIKNIEQQIVMYGLKTPDTESYRINIYYAIDKGFTKFTVHSNFALEDEKVIETIEEPTQNKYIPELLIVPSHDFKTYWKQDFNIDVQTFDAKINPGGVGFDGRVDGVDITAIISLGDEVLTTLKGVTEYGEWKSNYYIKENLVNPGEYTVDIIASYLDQTISKSSSMFIVGSVVNDGSSQHAPVAIASADDTTPDAATLVTLDGSASSDSDGDTLTFSWIQTSGTNRPLNDSTVAQPTFTSGNANDIYIFQLTVTDTTGRTGTDTVNITVNP